MSYPVRVVVKETVRDVVSMQDAVRLPLNDDPVLKKAGAQDVLRRVLQDRGWTSTCDDSYVKGLDNGTEIVWNLQTNEVVVQAMEQKEVTHNVIVTLRGDAVTRSSQAQQEADLRQHGQRDLQRKREEVLMESRTTEGDKLLKVLQQKLSESVDRAREEVNSTLESVYRQWLIEQAKQLGTVMEQSESVSNDGKIYELRIKIEA